MTYAVVRVRGHVNVRGQIGDTLRYLRLHRTNHCVLLPQTATVDGMLRRAKDYVTWGEVDPTVTAQLLLKRSRVDDTYVKAHTPFPSVNSLAKAVAAGEASLGDVPGVKPVIRLHPPRGGYEGTKRGYAEGGSLGYRGQDINALLVRMLGPGGRHG